MTEIRMPSLADSMHEGTISAWLKKDGEDVELGDELVEIETDKATMVCGAEASGRLRILAEAGATVAVGSPIAWIGGQTAENESRSTTVPDRDAGSEHPETTADVAPPQATSPAAQPFGAENHDQRAEPRATPLARLIARAQDVDLSSVLGTGPRGRVTRSDVVGSPRDDSGWALGAASSRVEAHPTQAQAAGVRVQEISRLQQTIARRMVEAQAIPDFQVQTEVVMDPVLALRAELKELDVRGVPSVNDFVVKAAALALREHERVNASYDSGRFLLHPRVNVGIAVAAPDALLVPVITDADVRSLSQIADEARRLATSVREGTTMPDDLDGGTFTVSNLGMFGMTAIRPILNPPQAAILGVGAVRELPTIVNGELLLHQTLTLTLTCDHRILYGADAARFLSRIRELLEKPLRLLA